MGQRLHLAKTLLHDPALLILDEPTAGLDPRARIEFRDLVAALAEAGKGILISSHILSELAESCDAILVIERGRKIVSGGIDEVARGLSGAPQGVPEDGRRPRRRPPLPRDPARRPGRPSSIAAASSSSWRATTWRSPRCSRARWRRACRSARYHALETDLEDIFLQTTKGRLQ